MKFRKANVKYPAQGLAEYGLIAVLVAIAGISALTMFGSSISGMLQGLQGSFAGIKTEAATTFREGSQPGEISATLPPGGSPATGQPDQSVPVNTPQGPVVGTSPAPDVSSPAPAPSTAGALGASEKILADVEVLEQLKQKLSLDPNTDPALLDLITKLAIAGHTLGDSVSSCSGMNCMMSGVPDKHMGFMDVHMLVMDYFGSHWGSVPMSVQQTINGAVDRINGNVSSVTGMGPGSIMGDGSTGGGSSGQIHDDANLICNNGGDTSQCTK